MVDTAPVKVANRRLAPVALGVTVALVYGQTLLGGFVWDDRALILLNEHLHQPGAILRSLTVHFWDSSFDSSSVEGYWRPTVKLTHTVLAQLGSGAWQFHLTNVVLHAAVSVLAWAWVRRRLVRAGHPDQLVEPAAFIAGLMFALHPSRYEVVGWVSCATELFFALFAIASFLLLEREDRGWWWGGLTVLLAGLSKETALLIPVALAVEWLLSGNWRARWPRLVVALVATLVPLLLRRALGIALLLNVDFATLTQRVTRVLAAFAAYHGRTVLPTQCTALADPSVQTLSGVYVLDPLFIAAGAVLVLGWSAALVVAWRRPSVRPLLADALLWLLFVAPVLQLIAVPGRTLASDRFLYLPLLGVCSLLSRALVTVLQYERWRRAALLASTGGALAFAVMLTLALPAYESNYTFFAREFTLHPRHPLIMEQYARVLGQEQKHFAEQAVLRSLLDMPGAPRREVSAALMVGSMLATTPDADRATLAQLEAFAAPLRRGALPPALTLGTDTWPMSGEALMLNLLLYGPDAHINAEVIWEIRARVGHPQEALVQALRERKTNPSLRLTWRVVRYLLMSSKWTEAAYVLEQDTAQFPALGPDPMVVQLRALARDAQSVPLDPLGAAVARTELLSRLQLCGTARGELAPFLTTYAQDPRLHHARVQIEVFDRRFGRALELVDEAQSRGVLPDPELAAERDELRAARSEWELTVATEQELANPALL